MRVIVLAGQLQLNPHSRCRMISLGGDPRWIGWDSTTEVAVAQYDLASAVAQGKKFNEQDRFPRPSGIEESKPALFAPSIADFSVGAFMSAINRSH